MEEVPALARARELFAGAAWAESYRLFVRADREAALDADDLERLATAAYLLGRDADSEGFRTRAHHTYCERGNFDGAARTAFWLGFGLVQRGAMAPASGWFARAERILDDAQLDSVLRGYLLIPSAVQRIVKGDPAAGDAAFRQAGEIARRFSDRELGALACAGRGRALIRGGAIPAGVALLDEAMVAVLAGDVSPLIAGDIYCIVLEGCQETFDVRRAYEWTTSLGSWCAAHPDLVRYRGECLLYRAEVMQLRGRWDDAARDAQAASELLASRPAAGAAFYRLGEIRRLRGAFADAEAAYMRANERGRKPQPGLSLLRLTQGEVEAAANSIHGVLIETRLRADRARMLGAAVEILLAAGALERARGAAAELAEIALAVGAPLLRGGSAHATGAVRLAEGDMADASAALREAWDIWHELEMPYEEAQTCLLMAAACERRGDQDGRRLELEAARTILKELKAEHCLTRIAGDAECPSRQSSGPLSEREAQVLRLLATGKTNRDVAEALFISEKTVARHVSNIFDKLGVSSRTAATAWAYEHQLI